MKSFQRNRVFDTFQLILFWLWNGERRNRLTVIPISHEGWKKPKKREIKLQLGCAFRCKYIHTYQNVYMWVSLYTAVLWCCIHIHFGGCYIQRASVVYTAAVQEHWGEGETRSEKPERCWEEQDGIRTTFRLFFSFFLHTHTIRYAILRCWGVARHVESSLSLEFPDGCHDPVTTKHQTSEKEKDLRCCASIMTLIWIKWWPTVFCIYFFKEGWLLPAFISTVARLRILSFYGSHWVPNGLKKCERHEHSSFSPPPTAGFCLSRRNFFFFFTCELTSCDCSSVDGLDVDLVPDWKVRCR